MGIGRIILDEVDAVADPGGMLVTVGDPITGEMRDTDFLDYSLPKFVYLPELRGALWADGIKPVRLVVEEKIFRASILAPKGPLDPSGQGLQATATFDCDAGGGGGTETPNGGRINLAGIIVTFMANMDVLRPPALGIQIQHGVNLADTLNSFYLMLTGGGTDGLHWVQPNGTDLIGDLMGVIEATSVTATTVVMAVVATGTGGNGVLAYLLDDIGLGQSWTLDHSLGSNGTTVGLGGTFEGGTIAESDPPGPGPGTVRYLRTYYREEDTAESGRSPFSEIVLDPAQDVLLEDFIKSNIDGDEDGNSHHRWYRTAAQGGIFRLGATIDYSNVAAVDTFSDTQLSGPGEVRYDDLAHRIYEDGYAPRVQWVSRHRGRIFGGGAQLSADYSVGFCVVVQGSFQVSVTEGLPTHDWEGRGFKLELGTEWYKIVQVNPGNGLSTFELNRPFKEADASGVGYVVSDVQTRNNNELFWSEPLKPSSWPTKNSLLSITTPSAEGITGMIEHQDALVVFTATGIWEVTPSALTEFQARNRYEGVGCVGGHSIVAVEGQLLFAAVDGIYAWSGSQAAPVKLTNPTVGPDGTASGIQTTWNRVNRAHMGDIESHFDAERRLVRWYVALDDDVDARHAVVLDLQTGSWGLDRVADIRTVETVVADSGELGTLAGNVGGQIFEIDRGLADGYFEGPPILTVTAKTLLTITVLGQTWTTDILQGIPVWVVSQSGDFYVETIVSNVSNTFTLAGAIPVEVGDQIVLGGIFMDMESGRWDLGDPGMRKTFARLRALYGTRPRGQYFVATGRDADELTVRKITDGDLSKSDGETLHRAQRVGRRHAYRLMCLEPGIDPEFTGVEIEIIGRDRIDA